MKNIKKKFSSLKFQIPFMILVFTLSTIIITAILVNNVTSKHLREDILIRNMNMSQIISEHIHLYLQNARETTDAVASFVSKNHDDKSIVGMKDEIFKLYDDFSYFDIVFYIDNDGHMLFSKPCNEEAYVKYNYKDRDYYKKVMKDSRTCISNLYISRVLGELHFIIASPVFNAENEVIGLIGTGIPLENIEEIIERSIENFNGSIYVVDSTGILLIHPDIDNISNVNKLENNPIATSGMQVFFDAMKDKEDTTISYQRGKNKYYSAVSFVDEVDWMIILEQSEKTIVREIIWLSENLKLISVYLSISIIGIGLLFAHKTTKPIEELVDAIGKLGDDFENVDYIDIETNNKEIAELASTFNDMSAKLKDSINELNKSYNRENYYRQYLDNILRSLSSGIIVINRKKYITIFNDAAEKITDFSRNECLGKDIELIFNKLELDLKEITERVMKGQEQLIVIERTIVIKDDVEVPINLFISPVSGDDQKIIGVIYLFNDISKAKELEEELSRSDRMHILGELSASLIHDVGNPLAGMKNLLELAKQNWEDTELMEQIYVMLDREISGLNDLVIDYLSFSKPTFTDVVDIDLFDLLDEVIDLLKPEIINKNIRLNKKYKNKEHASIEVNGNSVKHAFINILLNCIQASYEGGFINVQADASNDEIDIMIEDNGIGIDEKDLDRIFEPFYTTKKGGTGLGLSSAYKIIKEHNGDIDVSSRLGKGTRFLIIFKKTIRRAK